MDETDIYKHFVICLEIGLVRICAAVCRMKNYEEASGEFWGTKCIAALGRSAGDW